MTTAFWFSGYLFTTSLLNEKLSVWQEIGAIIMWPHYLANYVKENKK